MPKFIKKTRTVWPFLIAFAHEVFVTDVCVVGNHWSKTPVVTRIVVAFWHWGKSEACSGRG